MSLPFVIATILAASIWSLHRWLVGPNMPYPPGPGSASLFSGNTSQIPESEPWLAYESWSKLYGSIISLRLFRVRMVILNSAKVAHDLLELRSSIYSDRAGNKLVDDLVGRKHSMFALSFTSPRFRTYRKLLHSGLGPKATMSYHPIQVQETRSFLRSLLERPDAFRAHIRRNAAAVILKVAYGYQIEDDNDRLIQVVEDGIRTLNGVSPSRMYIFQSFPFLLYWPSWLPGGGFKRHAAALKERLGLMETLPFEWAAKNIKSGNYIESFASKHLRDNVESASEEEKNIVMWCSSALYGGGADTMVSALSTFFLLMAKYPKVQKRAQGEVDSISEGRLPTPDDIKSMPYVLALTKEILRWAPVAPLGLKHRVMVDDVYDGHFIPAGSVVIANIWAIAHDASVYPNPMHFNPERHLGESPQPDPFKVVFGYGRRVCPGAYFAEQSLLLNVASVLATFDISKSIDGDGNEFEPTAQWLTGITMHLKDFPCKITPRSQDMVANI